MSITNISIINNEQLVEGVIASIVFTLISYFLKYYFKLNYVLYISISWFITWIFRKFGVNTYQYYASKYNIQNKNYKL